MSERQLQNPGSKLPDGWARALVGELAEVGTGATPKRGTAQYYAEGTVPWITSGAVNSRRVTQANEYITEAAVRETNAKVFPAGTILIAMYGEGKTRGRAAELGIDAATNQALAAILLGPRATKLRPWLLLQLELNYQQTRLMSSGGVQPNLNLSHVRALEMLLPPIAEQERITKIVEAQLSRLDAAVAGLKRVQANLKRYRASVLKAAVEGRLVPTEAELAKAEGRSYEPAAELLARILKERRKRWEDAELASMKAKGKPPKDNHWKTKYQEPAAPVTKGLPELPEGWCWANLEALTSAVRVICYGILMPKANVPGGVPYVKVRDMRGGVLDVGALQRTTPEISASFPRSVLQGGDLLIAIRGTYGRVVEVPDELSGGNITQDSARLDLSPYLATRYIKSFLLSPVADAYLKRVARGVAVKGVNIADLRLTPIALPPFQEQHRVAERAEDQLSLIDSTAALAASNLARCTRLRQSILKWAFEGKLVDQDPSDEPASALLQRIRAEREAAAATSQPQKRSAPKPQRKSPAAPAPKPSASKTSRRPTA